MATKKKSAQKLDDLPGQSDPRAALDPALLLSAAQPVLKELAEDLLERARSSPAVTAALTARHEKEKADERTADPYDVWLRFFTKQVAAAWFLSCVFARVLEDRGLVEQMRIAGPGALDSQQLFFELAPSLSERDYLLTVFRELSELPAAGDLFDARHNPVWLLAPSANAASKLLALFRKPNATTPALRFGQADTRFLGDLYQELDEDVRDRFALLQTPHFVESFILDRTLERALERFGLDDTTLIDPTCGSGHFLLGAFDRLFEHRLRKEPGLDVRVAAARALDAVYGSDINPYAVAIARFRLTLAFLEKAGYAKLRDAPKLPVHLAVADSLLHNPQRKLAYERHADAHAQMSFGERALEDRQVWERSSLYELEDPEAVRDVLYREHAAVVGNPPYITVKDKALREVYRRTYDSAAGKYSLGAPFTERFFQLARDRGCVGMITANSFMKREFGKALIEECLPKVNLDGVMNTSGAYIPGHGTPTVLLFGTSEPKQGTDVLTVLAKRGEPSTPDDAERGEVWTSIAGHWSEVGFENDYVSVARVPRGTLEKHPWSLGGGGASELKELLEERAEKRLRDVIEDIGFASFTGLDDAFVIPAYLAATKQFEPAMVRPMVLGEDVRDWTVHPNQLAIAPYDVKTQEPVGLDVRSRWGQHLWCWRTTARNVASFGGKTREQEGQNWWEWYRWQADRYRSAYRITFAFVATHNHFVLDRGGKVFNRTAPIIKLPESATEEDHLALLAYLNSSTACFWMKQVFYPKATATGDISVEKGKPEANRYEFAGTALESLPVPSSSAEERAELIRLARKCEDAAREREALSPGRVVAEIASGRAPDEAISVTEIARGQLLELAKETQQEIDWLVYKLFGLYRVGDSTKACEDAALRSPELRTIESPMYKRLWLGQRGVFGHNANAFPEQCVNAARAYVANGAENLLLKLSAPVQRGSMQALLLSFRDMGRLVSWLETAGKQHPLNSILDTESVPFLSAYRYTDAGLEKRAAWERTWDLQRREDAGETVGDIPVAPKYDAKDFRDANYFRLRGKLDVPKERFISYPGCESDEDKEPVYGWAGWNHLQQAQALASLYQARKTEGWQALRLVPMLAGILELVPWVKQWHNEPSAEFDGLRLGDYFEGYVDGECGELGVTRDDLRAWRPEKKVRAAAKTGGGKKKGAT